MKYKDMENKATTDQYGYKYIDNSIMVGNNEVGCLTCGTPSKYIDVCSEAHFCSEECLNAFYKQYSEALKETELTDEM